MACCIISWISIRHWALKYVLDFEDAPAAMAIWNYTKIPSTKLLPLGSRFFGSFKLIDMHISKASGMEPSYVDYGFGSDRSRFAGCHRVQVTRSPQPEISLQQFICNPTKDTPSVAGYLEKFHFIYAKLLFADGVRSVLTGK